MNYEMQVDMNLWLMM